MPTSTARPSRGRADRALSIAKLLAVAAPLLLPLPGAAAVELGGYAALEGRAFADDPSFADQSDAPVFSLVLEPELYREWSEGDSSVLFQPFARFDSVDSDRTHFDVREFYWRRSASAWELLVGVSKVFWGVTESQHLVDVINQTDLVENPDGEDKLGQPMVKLSLIRSWGIVDLFALPGFRERTFPGVEGRLRAPLPVADDPIYESPAEETHLDWAVRWSHALGPFDIGLSHFSGTTREPRLVLEKGVSPPLSIPPSPSGRIATASLLPLYEQIDQTGLDLQGTFGSWLLKLEAIARSGQLDRFAATTAGFEYTFWSVFDSNLDVGAVVEHLWDERGERGPSPFQDDLFVGSRLAFNDTQDTQILAGAVVDRETDASLFLLEASRRLGSSWVIEAELRGFSGVPPTDPLASLRTDDYFQISIQRHF